MAPHWKCGAGKPVGGSNPPLSAIIWWLIDRYSHPVYHPRPAVLGGELAVPCTRNPLQRG
jgi:hypothetical protein